MKKRWVPLIVIVVIAGAAAAYWYISKPPASDARALRLSGNIEVTEVPLSFRLAGWVKERPVDEGQTVRLGQLVARLDDVELEQEAALRQAEVHSFQAALAELEAGSRPEEIAQAQAAALRAKANLDELLAGSRPQEIAASEATMRAAKADSERLRIDFDRIRKLYEKNVATEQEYTTGKALYDAAFAKLQQAEEQLKLVKEGPRSERIDQTREALKEANEHLALVRKGPRQETIDQARAQVERARQSLALARTRVAYATLASPVTGVVLSKNVEAGEFVAAGTPIVTVADLRSVWVRAYVNETDLLRVKFGDQAVVTTDVYPKKRPDGSDWVFRGRVSFISEQAEFTPKSVQTQKERVKLVYRIKIDIPNPDLELKPGMPADAVILLGTGGPATRPTTTPVEPAGASATPPVDPAGASTTTPVEPAGASATPPRKK
jgi:HlyD family secretion protein